MPFVTVGQENSVPVELYYEDPRRHHRVRGDLAYRLIMPGSADRILPIKAAVHGPMSSSRAASTSLSTARITACAGPTPMKSTAS
jgi:hypothetical protein